MDIRFNLINSKLLEISWPKDISPLILEEMMAVKGYLEKEYADGIKEIRMGYHCLSLKLQLDINEKEVSELLEEIESKGLKIDTPSSKLWTIPVCYGGEFGIDLLKLSKFHGLEPEEIIQLHSDPEYLLYFYGFLPGFMYLGGLNERLTTPRKSSPDRSVPAGSVAIGGKQTGIYPCESPGGWHVVGVCPIPLFDIHQDPPVVAKVNDRVKFRSIEKEEYLELREKSKTGKYQWQHD